MDGATTKIAELMKTDKEYKHVAGQFAKTCPKKITKVRRFGNRSIYFLFYRILNTQLIK